ncbi:hypothetical protein C8R43DRAFT_947977 [Mycena crocata]|nr:hypothetical protein C8R43DRAFT_947977 [Mycena crocata]
MPLGNTLFVKCAQQLQTLGHSTRACTAQALPREGHPLRSLWRPEGSPYRYIHALDNATYTSVRPVVPIRLKTSLTEVQERQRIKKRARARNARSQHRETKCIRSGSALKGITKLRVRRSVPMQLELNLDEYPLPVDTSGWTGVRAKEPDRRAYTLAEFSALDPRICGLRAIVDERMAGGNRDVSGMGPSLAICTRHSRLVSQFHVIRHIYQLPSQEKIR